MARLELALFTPLDGEQLTKFATSGVSRFEVCAGPYSSGGLTPSLEDVLTALSVSQTTGVQIHVMLRPRGGDFVYSRSEIEQMKRDLSVFAGAGVHGIVFGTLERIGSNTAMQTGFKIDAAQCREICALAQRHNVKAVFHRGFDEVDDWEAALDVLRDSGIYGILTAGGKGGALDGAERLRRTIPLARSKGITVIVGGGVRGANLSRLKTEIGNNSGWWHSAAIVDGSSEQASDNEVNNLLTATRESAHI